MSNKNKEKEEVKNNISVKKICLIVVLLVIIIAIAYVVINSSSGKKETQPMVNTTVTSGKSQGTNTSSSENTVASSENVTSTENASSKEKLPTTEKKLTDGTLYTVSDKEIKADIVIGDNYYDTQLADINKNFSQYDGKTIEIEGFFLKNEPYTFIGRYSESNLCSYCPVGYSYFEYEWHGDKEFNFTEEGEWLKIKGTLAKGNDGVEYYYINATSIEVMNEKGLDTVKN